MRSVVLIAFMLVWNPGSAATPAAPDTALARLRWLEGNWTGDGQGEPGHASLQRQIVCALDCRFLNVEGQFVRLQDNPGGEYSSALGMWGYDSIQGRLLLHTFDDVAAVTTYVEDPQASRNGSLVLASEDRRTGIRARFIYVFAPPDAYSERFEVAPRGGDFRVYVESRFVRDLKSDSAWQREG